MIPSIPEKNPGSQLFASEINAIIQAFISIDQKIQEIEANPSLSFTENELNLITSKPIAESSDPSSIYIRNQDLGSGFQKNGRNIEVTPFLFDSSHFEIANGRLRIKSSILQGLGNNPVYPSIDGFATLSVTGGTSYNFDFTAAPDGALMIISIYNSSSSATVTPPSGWTELINANGHIIYSKVKVSADTVPAFIQSTSRFVSAIGLWSSSATAVQTGTATANGWTNNNTNKGIPEITTTKESLLLVFVNSSSANIAENAPAPVQIVDPTGFTLERQQTEVTGSPYRNMFLFSKQIPSGPTGTVFFRVTDSSGSTTSGVLISMTI